jgi:hypothetical protein
MLARSVRLAVMAEALFLPSYRLQGTYMRVSFNCPRALRVQKCVNNDQYVPDLVGSIKPP